MKKIALLAGVALLMSASMSCSSNGEVSKENNDSTTVKKADPFESKTNIRYIDMDSISEHYNLVKDYKEWLMKENQRLEQQVKNAYAAAQKFEADCQKKAQNNGYLSEAAYKADVQKFQNMVAAAQKQEMSVKQKAAEDDAKWQKQLLDSINSYVIDYNKEKKYDAILLKAAGVYFNPSLDVTKDIIKGLNDRYNKVEKKDEPKADAKKEEKNDSTAKK